MPPECRLSAAWVPSDISSMTVKGAGRPGGGSGLYEISLVSNFIGLTVVSDK